MSINSERKHELNAVSCNILKDMLNGAIRVPYTEYRLIVFQYMAVVGCADKSTLSRIINLSFQTINNLYPQFAPKVFKERTVMDFCFNQLKCLSFEKILVKNSLYYVLTKEGFIVLANFLNELDNYWFPEDYLQYLCNGADVSNIKCSFHSAAAGNLFMQIFSRNVSISALQSLNTPVSVSGSINRNQFLQHENLLKADAFLCFHSFPELNFFIENDMSSENKAAIIDKLDRYSLFLSNGIKGNICIHFTISSALDDMNDDMDSFSFPSRTTLVKYKSVIIAFFLGYGLDPDSILSLAPKDACSILLRFIQSNSNLQDDFYQSVNEIFQYCLRVFSRYKDYPYFWDYFIPKKITDFYDTINYYRNTHSDGFFQRVKLLFSFIDGSLMCKFASSGLRITFSDNDSDGNEFVHTYPFLFHNGFDFYRKFMYQFLEQFWHDLYLSFYSSDELLASEFFSYKKMTVISTPSGNYYFANCFDVVINGRRINFVFENISYDYSGLKRVEYFLNNNKQYIDSFILVVCYHDHSFSYQMIEKIRQITNNTVTVKYLLVDY